MNYANKAATTETAGRFTLWHRSGKGHAWVSVATAPTESELTAYMKTLPSGEVITLPAGEQPR